MSEALPTTLTEWEAGLVDRFLRVGEGEESSPLRSFEITPETLATVFPDAGANPNEAAAAFQAAVRSDRYVFRAFRLGRSYPAGDAVPGCFAYLCASLLIDTLLDGAYSAQGEYRARLRTWLGTSRSMMQLSGIASMWRDLASWLEERSAAGDDVRTLLLPDPRAWYQIGHTRRLSFPTRSDLRFLARVLASFPRGSADPPGLVRAIETAIGRDNVSWGMEAAFGEFQRDFRNRSAMASHRFWRFILRAESAQTQRAAPAKARLELEYDEDGRAEFRLEGNLFPNLGSAIQSPPVARSANLGPAVQRGLLFFRQVGMARWVAEADPQPGSSHLAVGPGLAGAVRGTLIEFAQSGDWLHSSAALTPRSVDDLLARLRLGRLRREHLVEIAIEGAVHIGGGLLGRPTFLPRIETEQRQVIVRALADTERPQPPAQYVNGALVADEPLHGRYELSIYADDDSGQVEWSKRLRFFENAPPHADLSCAALRETPIAEWTETGSADLPQPEVAAATWDAVSQPMADLLEALYASGRSGLSDGDVLDLLHRANPKASPWDRLRSIQESDFLCARQRSKWRGRIWTLGAPRLIDLGSSVRVEGATCALLEEEFRAVAAAAGGVPFRRMSALGWSPPVIGAIGIEAAVLAAALGWEVAQPGLPPACEAPYLETSRLVGGHHRLASSWDWRRRRFVTAAVAPSDVSITRWVHPGERDHDQYRVTSAAGETRHATRNAAILQGHIAAGVPLFEIEGDTLVRTSAEGALPLEVAKWLRGRATEGGGPAPDGRYAYPLGGMPPRALAAALPGCIDGLAEQLPSASPREVNAATLARARRSGGRVRLHWTNGEVRAA